MQGDSPGAEPTGLLWGAAPGPEGKADKIPAWLTAVGALLTPSESARRLPGPHQGTAPPRGHHLLVALPTLPRVPDRCTAGAQREPRGFVQRTEGPGRVRSPCGAPRDLDALKVRSLCQEMAPPVGPPQPSWPL